MRNIIIYVAFGILSIQGFTQTHKSPIYAEVYGSGQPILFIPGFSIPGDVWKPTTEKLKSNYECHVLTLAGFGEHPPIDFPWLPDINTSIESYIASQKLEDVIVIGHSLGGTIAGWLASRGNHISRLILIDALPASGALMIPNYNPKNLVYETPYNAKLLEMNEEDFNEVASTMAKGMSASANAQEQIKTWILQADRKTYVYGYTDYLKLDVREDLKQINIPVTIIAATQPYGKEMASRTYGTQYKNLKSYDLIFADQAAHFVMLDKPEWFMSTIETLLQTP